MPGDLLRISDLDNSTPIKIDFQDGAISLSVNDVLRWLAPEAPPGEAMRFLLTCRLAGIDPFRHEAHLIPYDTKQGRRWTIVIDKSGWLRMAEGHPAYDGCQSGIILRDPKTGEHTEVEGAYVPPGVGVVGGWAKVFRKDRKIPVYSRIGSEYAKGNSPMWQSQMPTMYRKTALISALRESGLCFGYGGAYDRAEMPDSPYLSPPGERLERMTARVAAEYQNDPMPSLNCNLVAAIDSAIGDLEMSDYQVQVMLAKRGVSHITQLSEADANDILLKLRGLLDERDAGEIMLPDPEATQQGGDTEADQLADEVAEDNGLADGEWVDDGGEVHRRSQPEIPEQVMDEMELESTDPIMQRDEDVVRNFNIDTPEPDDVNDVTRPATEPKKSRKKSKV